MKFFNTLGRTLVEFSPIEPGHARLYTCGPTVYDHVHIGNWRAFLFGDVLRRALRERGLRVTQVMNLTDVDDKIVAACRRTLTPLGAFTEPFKRAFFEGLDLLGIERAEHYPEASCHIAEMVDLVLRLRARGFTYDVEGSVYFRISSFEPYGRLSGIEGRTLRAGAGGRVQSDEYAKEDVRDFALWKAWVPQDGEVFWETPLGKGRPGWHLECSAMSMKYLGERFDIHTGGIDLCFPHHDNEIAQSEGATGHPFVNVWMHNAHLSIDGQKMSKSLGNLVLLPALLDKGTDPMAVRLALISTHYRQPANFSLEGLEGAASSLRRLRDFASRLERLEGESAGAADPTLEACERAFDAAIDDDLNVSLALGALFDMVRIVHRLADAGEIGRADGLRARDVVGRLDRVLGLRLLKGEDSPPDADVDRLIEERRAARAA
ncbi:MAG: cysteine--tRNA ligase, partial [Planctomycetes bacterium]|nr:cysteine--tRNA ligase [Planctomycetota bacterium]